jgi:NhaA family Na+:H+ antiporter
VKAPDARTGSRQAVAHSWRETDRFVPRKVVRPIQRLMQVETSSAVAVLGATVAALAVAYSGLAGAYDRLWDTSLSVTVGDVGSVHLTLHAIVSDGLMAIFFLLVSLEIKREAIFGELRDPRAAALPIVAAVGGMIVPALIYVVLMLEGRTCAAGASLWPPTLPSRSPWSPRWAAASRSGGACSC